MPFVQHKAVFGNQVATTLTATFDTPSTAGNCLFAWIGVKQKVDPITVSVPAGWTIEHIVWDSANPSASAPLAVFAVRPNSTSQTGLTVTLSETAGGANAVCDTTINLWEWSG